MSRINKLRIINLYYNNNTMKIDDEIFDFGGESTLLSLRNGGGKTVLVQMMTAPFVNKRYRDTKDRPFKNYFTTNRPSFIMMEWLLEGGQGYVLTGMMVRKNQNYSEDDKEELEIINFIAEYKKQCEYDIFHLPIVEKTEKSKTLKSFAACRDLFETLKKDRESSFYYYDMNAVNQRRQYFQKLREYQIDYKEWETIIKKVNQQESGLSELFADAKDERGLIEKWFLEAVASKLNKEKDRIQEFEHIVFKYIRQYRDNTSKIARREIIRLFQEEAKTIQESLIKYKDAGEQECSQKNKIACFMKLMEQLTEKLEKKQQGEKENLEALEEEILEIKYAEKSFELHELEKKRLTLQNLYLNQDEHLKICKYDLEKWNKKIGIINCARQYSTFTSAEREVQRFQEKSRLLFEKQKDLEPERKAIGSRLYRHYADCFQKKEIEWEALRLKKEDCLTKKEENLSALQKAEAERAGLQVEKGRKQGHMEEYERLEASFNRRYEEALHRTIIGEYSPGTLDIMEESLQREMDGKGRQLTANKKRVETLRGNMNTLTLSIRENDRNAVRIQSDLELLLDEKKALKQEEDERLVMMRYVGLGKEAVYSRELILECFEKKLAELEELKQKSMFEIQELQKEYDSLVHGRVLELPENVADHLQKLDIDIIYGMEWLKKNEREAGYNEMLVQKNPFIPYSIIMTGRDMEKLEKNAEDIFTAFPIPVICRENLEKISNLEPASLVHMDRISFLVVFNRHLLQPEKLKELLLLKKELLEKKRKCLLEREEEISFYRTRQTIITFQKLTREVLDTCLKKIHKKEEEKELLEKELDEQRENLQKFQQEFSDCEDLNTKLSIDIKRMENKIADFRILKNRYGEYIHIKEQMDDIIQTLVELEKQADEWKRNNRELDEAVKDYEHQLAQNVLEKSGLRDQLLQFEIYKEEEMISEQEDIGLLESRYEAITEKLAGDYRDISESLEKAQKELERQTEELDYIENKYKLKEEDYREITYRREDLTDAEKKYEATRRESDETQTAMNKTSREEAVLGERMKILKETMYRELQRTEPMPSNEIVTMDFKAEIQIRMKRKSYLMEELCKIEKRLDAFRMNFHALSEFNHLAVRQEISFEENLEEMTEKGLSNFRGILKRDLNGFTQAHQREKERAVQVIRKVSQKQEFQDEFFKKAFENLLDMMEEGSNALEQLDITLSSYASILKKLDIDLANIEREQKKVEEILLDYVEEVHENLGRIDKSSTITVHGRSLKMLKIKLPDYFENKGLYQIRIHDFVEELTAQGVKVLDENGNIQEFIGKRINTKSVYDSVAGIGNIEIKLFKIEENREYQISWAEVSANSGGEGFLSAFVILSSLLSYMRRDETDIFSEHEEGKVLVMDNPFAQTNAAHLLKPLMEIAKKANTQLICLSGLGGESIYNRFDNIYVLNLVSPGIRKNVQYLKAEHLKGDEEQEMVLSQLKIEQMGMEEFIAF